MIEPITILSADFTTSAGRHSFYTITAKLNEVIHALNELELDSCYNTKEPLKASTMHNMIYELVDDVVTGARTTSGATSLICGIVNKYKLIKD